MNNKESESITVLDHGYIKLIESWGSDESIISAARMSTNKGFLGWGPKHGPGCKAGSYMLAGGDYVDPLTCGCEIQSGDEKLLRYLYEHKHSTPFEMAGMIIEVQAPILVFREWHRHRTQSYNEMSARYTQMPDLHYVPSIDRIKESAQASKNKQASGSGTEITDEVAMSIQHRIALTQRSIYDEYEAFLKIYGLSKEIARLNTPVSRYSRMRASANLRNWLAFLTLRMDQAAQYEIRCYANVVGSLISNLFTRTWELFDEGRAIA